MELNTTQLAIAVFTVASLAATVLVACAALRVYSAKGGQR